MSRAAPKLWSEAETQFLADNYHLQTVREIALQLGRPVQAVMYKATTIGVSDLVTQRLLRCGKRDEALARQQAAGKYCKFITTRFGHETPGYMPAYATR